MHIPPWLWFRPGRIGLAADRRGVGRVQQGSFSAFQTLRTRSFWLIACGDGLATTNVPDLTGTALALALSASTLGFTLVGGLVVGDHIPKPAALASCTAVQEVAWAEE